jgi:hypothetical protein
VQHHGALGRRPLDQPVRFAGDKRFHRDQLADQPRTGVIPPTGFVGAVPGEIEAQQWGKILGPQAQRIAACLEIRPQILDKRLLDDVVLLADSSR